MKHYTSILLSFLSIVLCAQSTEEFKPSGKIISQVFGDYYYVASADSNNASLSDAYLKKNKDFNAFTLRRVWLGYNYIFSPKVNATVVMEADQKALTDNGKSGFYIKEACIKWNLVSSHTVHIGLQQTFGFEVSLRYWGHRFIDKSALDVWGLVGLRDLGVSLRGDLVKDKIYYAVMLGNNSGEYVENNNQKRAYGIIGFKPTKHIDITLYNDYTWKAPVDRQITNENITALFCGYKDDTYTLGIDLFMKNAQHAFRNADSTMQAKNAVGASVFGTAALTEKIGAFARYDLFDPNFNVDVTTDARNLIIAGLEYKVIENFIISPNVEIEIYQKTDRNIRPSVWTRLTFYWFIK